MENYWAQFWAQVPLQARARRTPGAYEYRPVQSRLDAVAKAAIPVIVCAEMSGVVPGVASVLLLSTESSLLAPLVLLPLLAWVCFVIWFSRAIYRYLRWEIVVRASACLACGYDLRGSTSGRCSECGADTRPPGVESRPCEIDESEPPRRLDS